MHIDFIVISWAIVVAILGLRLLLGIFWLRSYSNGKRGDSNSYWQQRTDQLAARFQIAKPVLVRIVNDLESPITIGWIQPMILIPASLVTGMTPSYLEALIAHELAHISRFDYVVNFIQNLIEMVLFFHPAVWWISKKIRTERENIADDLAASMLGEPRRLALALQELDYIQFTTPQLAQAAHGGNLMLRIKRLVRPEAQSINWKTAVTVFGMDAACLGMVANANVAPTQTTKSNEMVSSREFKGKVNFTSHGCAPDYPKESLVKQETGVTRLKVFMASDGRVGKVDILKSSGWPNLDNAVKGKLLAGECKGAIVKFKGVPQATASTVEYVWKLD
jgi:D-alanyl-D-alanine endopeptidase (penicillin-binding protein 7)